MTATDPIETLYRDINPLKEVERIARYNSIIDTMVPKNVGLSLSFQMPSGARLSILGIELSLSVCSAGSLSFILEHNGAHFNNTLVYKTAEEHPLYNFVRLRRTSTDGPAILQMLLGLNAPIHYISHQPTSMSFFIDAAMNWRRIYKPTLQLIFGDTLRHVQEIWGQSTRDILLMNNATGDTILHEIARVSVMPGEDVSALKFLTSKETLSLIGWKSIKECLNKKGESPIRVATSPSIKKYLLQLK